MTTRITPPDWGSYDPNMLVNVADIKYYYENFTEVVDSKAQANELAIKTLDGRVTKVEQEIPVGPGGTGAFLNLGGVPERYPTAEEMNINGNETGFMVIARSDGIYFYNPVTKLLIKPKTGGGTIAVHGQLPMVYDESHSLQHNGRAGSSGIYTAKVTDVGLSSWVSQEVCQIIVVATENEELHTAMGKDGFASRVFRKGDVSATWSFFTGGSGGGGGSIDPAVIDDINKRLDALEQYDPTFKITDLEDVILDPVLDIDGLLYMDSQGTIRGGSTNPMLSMGYTHVHTNSVGAPPVVAINNVSSPVVASNNVIVLTATATKTVTLPAVVPYNTYKPATTQVREGRTTFIVNMSDFPQTVRVSPAHMFYVEGSMDSTNAVVPPKTVFVYNPAIIDNGSGVDVGCWIYMGNYQLRASDLSSVMLEIKELQDKAEEQQAEIESIREGFNDMSSGDVLTSYNGLGCRPVASSNDVAASSIAANPFVVGQSGNTGKKFILPDIAPLDTVKLPAETVREGRVTILMNSSTVPRTVQLINSCKFNMNGSSVTTPQTIPAQTTWLFSPGVYNNGDKVWTYLGTMFGDVNHSILNNNYTKVGHSNIAANTSFVNGSLLQTNMPSCRFMAVTGTTARLATLPEIVSYSSTAPLTNTQVRQGYIITLSNTSNKNLTVYLAADQKWSINNQDSDDTRVIPAGVMETWIAVVVGNVQKWVLLSRNKSDGSPVEFDEVNSRLEVIENTSKSKFVELDDTPTGYQPGKLLGYNLSGNALIAVDPINTLKAMTDTPNDYTGHAKKTLTVKQDESGLEFTPFPDMNGLISDINNIHNDMIGVQNNQTVQSNKITALETETSNLDARIAVVEGNTSSPMRIITPELRDQNFSQSDAAKFNPCILRSSTNRSLELPDIVASGTTPSSSQCVEGTFIKLLNHSSSATFTINAGPGRLISWQSTVTEASHTLPGNTCMEVVAMKVGSSFVWKVIQYWKV